MPKSLFDNRTGKKKAPFFSRLIATGFFSGYIPWASGTFGTITGIIIYLVPGVENPSVLEPLIVLGFFIGVFTSHQLALFEGNKLAKAAELAKAVFQEGEHEILDPSIVVIDKMVGIWITLLFLPKTWIAILIAFIAFRIFEITKPPPARQLELLPNGWGIMLDDVVAGIYALMTSEVAYYLIIHLFPGH